MASQPSQASTHGQIRPVAPPLPLIDQFDRVHRSLRISITDICNIRCQYCMPSEAVQFMPRDHLLSYDAIVEFARIAISCGISRFRITGGEPLTRPGLATLVQNLDQLDGAKDLAMTTNGMLLAKHAAELATAGLRRVNISLDTLREETFKRLSRRDGIASVVEGIDAALANNFEVKLNSLVLRDINSQDVIELVDFARTRDITVRFIEFMPLDADGAWNSDTMVSGAELRRTIEQEIGPLSPIASKSAAQPAREFSLPGGGRVGFIDSVSQPFCGNCDRLRLTAEGKLRNCLFGQEEWDVARLLSASTIDRQEIESSMRRCIQAKHAAHGIDNANFVPPKRAMYQIGG